MPKRQTSVGISHVLLGEDIDKELDGLSVAAREYIEALKAENLKAQMEIVKLKAESVTYKHRVTVLEKRWSERHLADLEAALKDDPRFSVEALLNQAESDKDDRGVDE